MVIPADVVQAFNRSCPVRNRNGSNVTSLSAQVNDCPMPFALLEVGDSRAGEFMATESAGEQYGKQRQITFALHPFAVWRPPECLTLFGAQPVTKLQPQFLYALHSSYSRG